MAQKITDQKEEVVKKDVKKAVVPKAETAKVEVPEVEEQNESSYMTDSFIETFWDQFEGALSRTRGLRERRQELYQNAIKETTKFNRAYRNTLKGFVQATNLNGDIRKGLFQNNIIKTKDASQEMAETLTGKVSETASKLKEFYLSPINTVFDLMERTENILEQNSEAFLNYTNEARNSWGAVTDNYIKHARNTHLNIAHRVEDSVRVLVKTGK
ncbi:hypothetical protein [Neobacillus niacini]|uniref:hypothetical protein n=1 Tax=Neobacillus niacini TaxID=86668 RepID=UPI003982D8C2